MAQAILLQEVESLGERGEVVDVSPGYLRNYLAPRKLAQPATPASIAEAEGRREREERAATEAADELCRAGGGLGVAPTSPCDAGYFGERLACSLAARGGAGGGIDAGCRGSPQAQKRL